MQCFTRKSLQSKTVNGVTYKPPPKKAYHPRPRAFNLTPDWAGRATAPDARAHRPHVDRPEMMYHPTNHVYREVRMEEMLTHINKVNWSTTGDARIHPPRTKPFSETQKRSNATINRSVYIDHGPHPVPDPYPQDNYIFTGSLPRGVFICPSYRPVGQGMYSWPCGKPGCPRQTSLSNLADDVPCSCLDGPDAACEGQGWSLHPLLPKINN